MKHAAVAAVLKVVVNNLALIILFVNGLNAQAILDPDTVIGRPTGFVNLQGIACDFDSIKGEPVFYCANRNSAPYATSATIRVLDFHMNELRTLALPPLANDPNDLDLRDSLLLLTGRMQYETRDSHLFLINKETGAVVRVIQDTLKYQWWLQFASWDDDKNIVRGITSNDSLALERLDTSGVWHRLWQAKAYGYIVQGSKILGNYLILLLWIENTTNQIQVRDLETGGIVASYLTHRQDGETEGLAIVGDDIYYGWHFPDEIRHFGKLPSATKWYFTLKAQTESSPADLDWCGVSNLSDTDISSRLNRRLVQQDVQSQQVLSYLSLRIPNNDSARVSVLVQRGDSSNSPEYHWDYVLERNGGIGEVKLEVAQDGRMPTNYAVQVYDEDSTLLLSTAADYLPASIYFQGGSWNTQRLRVVVKRVNHLDSVLWHGLEEDQILVSAYPNPFNTETQISVYSRKAGHLGATLYDIRGAFVRTIADETITKGWHLKMVNLASVSSGVYYCRIEFEGKYKMVKLLLLK